MTNPPQTPPASLNGNARGYWNVLRHRFATVDREIRREEELGNKPQWLHGRRAERAALAWFLNAIADVFGKEVPPTASKE